MAGSKLPAPLWAYREPPATLTNEWARTYRALIEPICIVVNFQADHARRGTRGLFEAWLDTLRRGEAGAEAILQFLHGRSSRSWTAGRAILAAVTPIGIALTSTIRFLSSPTSTRQGPEETAKKLRADIAHKLEALEPRPLLDELAAAVVADCAGQLGRTANAELGSNTPKGQRGRRGYPLEVLHYAKSLRIKHPRMKASAIRRKCLEKGFSQDDMPPDGDSFRAWLNRKRTNRTK